MISATQFVYRRRRYMPLVSYQAWRLRRAWGSREGAVGLLTGAEPLRATTYTVSVWASDADLRRFLRAPEHLDLIRAFRPRLARTRSVVWTADRVIAEEAWREDLRRLAEVEGGAPAGHRSGRPRLDGVPIPGAEPANVAERAGRTAIFAMSW